MFNQKEYSKTEKEKNRKRIWNKEHPEYQKEYRKKHKESFAEYRKKYCEENKEKIMAMDKQWRKNNPEKTKEIKNQWKKTEKGKVASQRDKSKRRAKLREIINTLTVNEWIEILKQYHFKCAYCGKEFDLFDKPTKDHIIPISKGGDNTKENITPACRSCNSKKNNKII
jgi:5-methylcytosine-specific restriction endonuclease McrA